MPTADHDVVAHFTARAGGYDRSSSWCTDDELHNLVLSLTEPQPHHHVLDVACGTGLVSRLFAGRVQRLVGVDITTAMAVQARPYLDDLVLAPAESLPFPDGAFDVTICRQGIQFMRLPDAVREMVRVTRPGGRVALINLCAYGPQDRDEWFEILRLRNPVRRHFFMPGDLAALLREAGCTDLETRRYVSVEDVDVWSDNGAIDEEAREAIRQVYRNASPAILELHAVQLTDGRIVDRMLFEITVGRPNAA
ncbi:class I SAM-dependent methyltransferase [Paractinoplanes hotanensis]|uniref:Methyltransferase domain-containing protein n=1 Tax=Paractinoplanes hotanensis TaxID=2906497 RepID=A0ABT0YBX0_9ACTN|nr:class I SAM-dependent methyltransferase [Actinoplanes hotanensis]MCM4083542.1 methyltransferase domain-containing protein [Actinoplanes hotanensis]